MEFKKIYIEITNRCNLNCSFCSIDNRENKELTKEQFKSILDKINDYTDYIYLHVKGEPLLHTALEDILDITKIYNKKVCITTNGTLLKEKYHILKKYNNIYQINISLHSENKKDNYLESIFEVVDNLNTYISYRLWTLDNDKMDDRLKGICDKLKEKYKIESLYNGIKLADKVYLSIDNKFVWPDINNNYYDDVGYCQGGKSQLAILSDGTISICCLDSKGESDLGNIFSSTMEEILTSDKYQNSIKYFRDNKCYLDICKHCSYKDRFK